LDLGEAEAIALAQDISADRLLIDERKGRAAAQQLGINVIGAGGIVILARKRGLIESATDLLDSLETIAGMYISADLKAKALAAVGE